MMPALVHDSLAATLYATSGAGGLAVLLVGALLTGAAMGSFINACAMRLVRGEDFVFAASRCRGCERRLGKFENLPVFGFLRRAGHCLCGKMRLDARYIALECLFAVLMVNYALVLPLTAVVGFAVASLFLGIAMLTDFEAMVLHPPVLAIAAALGLAFALAGQWHPMTWLTTPLEAFAGMVVGTAMPITVNAVYLRLRGQPGFGAGDAWLLGAIGAWLGPVCVVLVFLAACCLGAVTGIYLIVKKRATATTRLPFGVFLTMVFAAFPNALLFLNQ